MISSPAEADKIGAAALQEAEEIMAITYPAGNQLPAATTTTQTVQSATLTVTSATTVATVTDCLDHEKTRPAAPSFTMTTNPLLMVNTGNDGNTNSFITPTLVTNHHTCQDNCNTVAFDNNVHDWEKQINTRLTEIANQGPAVTTVTNRHDCPSLTDVSLHTTANINNRVCTQIKITHTLRITIDTTTVHRKVTLTEPATTAA